LVRIIRYSSNSEKGKRYSKLFYLEPVSNRKSVWEDLSRNKGPILFLSQEESTRDKKFSGREKRRIIVEKLKIRILEINKRKIKARLRI